jgi:hypothetical protein
MIRPVGRESRLRIEGHKPHQPHQAADSFPIHPIALASKPGGHAPRP